MRSCSYTRKNVHRKKKQGQEVSCIQNGMGVGGEPYIAYDPMFGIRLYDIGGSELLYDLSFEVERITSGAMNDKKSK